MIFTPMTITRTHVILFFLSFIAVISLEIYGVDFYVQNFFYNPQTHTWLVDGADPLLKMIFYKGPKYAIACFGCTLLGRVLYQWMHEKKMTLSEKKMLVVILSLIFIPTMIALFKELTYVHCPSRLHLYGGASDFQDFFHLFSPLDPLDRGKCFPAGHASGGFALMSLYVFGKTPSTQWAGVGIGFSMGWVMAFYQMAKGAHFLSHSCMTMIISWAMITGLSHLLSVNRIRTP